MKCEPVGDYPGGEEIHYQGKTDLDFERPDPKGFTVDSSSGPNKVACEDGFGLFVSYSVHLREPFKRTEVSEQRPWLIWLSKFLPDDVASERRTVESLAPGFNFGLTSANQSFCCEGLLIPVWRFN
jgi:hypothetical protein